MVLSPFRNQIEFVEIEVSRSPHAAHDLSAAPTYELGRWTDGRMRLEGKLCRLARITFPARLFFLSGVRTDYFEGRMVEWIQFLRQSSGVTKQ
jgi:hypothetical protein